MIWMGHFVRGARGQTLTQTCDGGLQFLILATLVTLLCVLVYLHSDIRVQPSLVLSRKMRPGLACSILLWILMLGWIQGSSARPDFETGRRGSELLRRRPPLSAEEPLRFKHYLRQALPNGNTLHVHYDVTRLNTTRVLDEMAMVETVRCSRDALALTLGPDHTITDAAWEFHVGAVVAGGSEWGCKDPSVENSPGDMLRVWRRQEQQQHILISLCRRRRLSTYLPNRRLSQHVLTNRCHGCLSG